MTNDDVEQRLAALCSAGQHEEAFRIGLEEYGDEIGGFLAARLLDTDKASDAFSFFAEELWKSLASFKGASSFRTWAYVIARRSATRVMRERFRHAKREVPLSQAPLVDRLEGELRSATTQWKKTEVKDRVAALRKELTEEERELLVLRVDRGMTWLQIAEMFEEDGDPKKRAASLRKRFERAKDHLRELAIRDGLLPQ